MPSGGGGVHTGWIVGKDNGLLKKKKKSLLALLDCAAV